MFPQPIGHRSGKVFAFKGPRYKGGARIGAWFKHQRHAIEWLRDHEFACARLVDARRLLANFIEATDLMVEFPLLVGDLLFLFLLGQRC